MEIKDLRERILEEIGAAGSAVQLEQVRIKYLGRKDGELNNFLKGLKDMPEEERRRVGPVLQGLRRELEDLLEKAGERLSKETEENKKPIKSGGLIYNPKVGHLHPVTQTIRDLNGYFASLGYSVVDGPEIETDEFCFERLNVPKDHPAREMQDTIYLKQPQYLLRTHTSSVESRVLAKFEPPYKVVCPGRAYRNEKVNRSNHFVFHQYQGFAVMPNASLKDLFGTLTGLFQRLFGPKVVVRFRNKYYPEVEPGVGPDMLCFNCSGKGCGVCKGVGWIEMGGAGLIHPNLMKMAGLDTKKWRGFAFGLGLDRWVMARYKIDDIRVLTGGDLAYRYEYDENTF